MRRRVWVTGATGFLGVATCRALQTVGYDVIRVERHAAASGGIGAGARPADRQRTLESRPARAAAADPGTVVACDLAEVPLSVAVAAVRGAGGDLDDTTPDATSDAPAGADADTPRGDDLAPDAVVHLAAEVPSSFEGEDAERAARCNRAIDDNVFGFAASVGAGLVFASSGSVYGEGRGQVFSEDGPTAPRGPYASAKLRSEVEGAALSRQAGISFAALRVSAPYGPGQRTAAVVQHFLRRAMGGDDLTYHGSGSRMQDFVYVADVAEAIVRCVAASASGVFNIASGRPVSMVDLAHIVAEVAGGDVGVGPSGRPDPQEGLTANYSIDAAERMLEWSPATSLRTGLGRWREHLTGGAA